MERRRRALILLLLFLVESAFLPVQCQVLRTNHPPPFNFSSGIVRLIIKSYTDELIRDLGDSPTLRLSESQAEFLRQRLGRLYEHVRRHPALHQRYLWVGRDRPMDSPDEPPLASPARFETASTLSKRGDSRQERSSPPQVPQGGERGSVRGVKRTPPETPIAPLSEEICRTSTAWERLNETVDSARPASALTLCTTATCHRGGAVEVPHHCTCKITPKVIAER
ncbi:hypothetical protein MTO96_023599 [Rhipicephalus appendiculatus]